jgi:purine-cytosine permease-like protein
MTDNNSARTRLRWTRPAKLLYAGAAVCFVANSLLLLRYGHRIPHHVDRILMPVGIVAFFVAYFLIQREGDSIR